MLVIEKQAFMNIDTYINYAGVFQAKELRVNIDAAWTLKDLGYLNRNK